MVIHNDKERSGKQPCTSLKCNVGYCGLKGLAADRLGWEQAWVGLERELTRGGRREWWEGEGGVHEDVRWS